MLRTIVATRRERHVRGDPNQRGPTEHERQPKENSHVAIPDIDQESLIEIDKLFEIGLDIPTLW